MKIIRNYLLLLIALLAAPALAGAAPAKTFEETAEGKAARQMLDRLGPYANELKAMTLQKALEAAKTSGPKVIFDAVRSKTEEKVKQASYDYALKKVREQLFQQEASWMWHQAIIEGRPVGQVWSDVDARIKGKIDSRLSQIKTTMSGLQFGYETYRAMQKGPDEGFKYLGNKLFDMAMEYAVPGWGEIKMAHDIVVAMGEYVVKQSFEDSYNAILIDMSGYDYRRQPKEFAQWLLKLGDVKGEVQKEWDEQYSQGASNWISNLYMKGKLNEGEEMKNKLIADLTARHDELIKAQQEANAIKAKMEQLANETRAAADKVRTIAQESLNEADVAMAPLQEYIRREPAYQKQDLQEVIIEEKKTVGNAAGFTPFDRGLLTMLESVYDQVTDDPRTGYDSEAIKKKADDYNRQRDEILNKNITEALRLEEIRKKLYDEYLKAMSVKIKADEQRRPTEAAAYDAWVRNGQHGDPPLSYGQTPAGKAEQEAINIKYTASQQATANVSQFTSTMTKDRALFEKEESLPILDAQLRLNTMVDKLGSAMDKLQGSVDRQMLEFREKLALLDAEKSTVLSFPNYFDDCLRGVSYPEQPAHGWFDVGNRMIQPDLGLLENARQVRAQWVREQQAALALWRKRQALYLQGKTAYEQNIRELEIGVSDKLRAPDFRNVAQKGAGRLIIDRPLIWPINRQVVEFQFSYLDLRMRTFNQSVGPNLSRSLPGITILPGGFYSAHELSNSTVETRYANTLAALDAEIGPMESVAPQTGIAIAHERIASQLRKRLYPKFAPWQLKGIDMKILARQKDGVFDPAVTPEESDAPVFIEELRKAWADSAEDINRLKELRAAYDKAAVVMFWNDLREQNLVGQFLEIPLCLKALEDGLAVEKKNYAQLLATAEKDLADETAELKRLHDLPYSPRKLEELTLLKAKIDARAQHYAQFKYPAMTPFAEGFKQLQKEVAADAATVTGVAANEAIGILSQPINQANAVISRSKSMSLPQLQKEVASALAALQKVRSEPLVTRLQDEGSVSAKLQEVKGLVTQLNALVASQEVIRQDADKVKEFYGRFKDAYETRNDSVLMSMIGDDWSAGDGTTLSDLQANLSRTFRLFDEVKYSISNLNISPGPQGRQIVTYDVTIISRIYRRNIKHVESSQVSEELAVDDRGTVKIIRTLNGRFWYIE